MRCSASPDQWHYCVSEENMADLLSEGLTPNSWTIANCGFMVPNGTTLDTINLDVFDMLDECMVEHKQAQRDTAYTHMYM